MKEENDFFYNSIPNKIKNNLNLDNMEDSVEQKYR